jgi:hypothetical protein
MASTASLKSSSGSCVVDPCVHHESFQDDSFDEEEALFSKKFEKSLKFCQYFILATFWLTKTFYVIVVF